MNDQLASETHPAPVVTAAVPSPTPNGHTRAEDQPTPAVGDPTPTATEAAKPKEATLSDPHPNGHHSSETQASRAVGDLLPPPAIDAADPNRRPLAGGPTSTNSLGPIDTQRRDAVGGPTPPDGHFRSDAHGATAVGGHPSTNGQRRSAAQRTPVVGGPQPDPTQSHAASETQPSTADGWVGLRILAEQYEDAQKARIACENRLRRAPVHGNDYQPQLDAMRTAETVWKKALRTQYRTGVPDNIREWQKDTVGIGEHLLARLLGTIGHPVHTVRHHWEGTGDNRTLHADGPHDRRVSDLWQYCGHGDPNRRRRKGQTPDEAAASGNPRAKMLTRLLAEACMKQRRSPYRRVYDDARELYATREGWTPLHQHNAALRKVGKEILRDLWQASQKKLEDQIWDAGLPDQPKDTA